MIRKVTVDNLTVKMHFKKTLLLCVFVKDLFATGSNLPYKNEYGDDYGTKWILFPDGEGFSHYVNLNEAISLRQLMEPDYEIQFRLYTRNTRTYELLNDFAQPVNGSGYSSHFIPGAPVKVVTHGWMSSADKNAVINIKNEYLRGFNYNVIAVDWSKTADFLMYPSVAIQTKAVGNIVGLFLDALCEKYNVTGDQLHLIGHSLGAHIMGNAASKCRHRVNRVTGLDPARPMFELPPVPDYFRLDKSDAVFVDVIHTCGGMLGVEEPVGHVDFFPNSGYAPQPGCEGMQAIFEACSHSRAHLLFAESINHPQSFPAVSCGSWRDFSAQAQLNCKTQKVFMGESASKDVTGVFYLYTNKIWPFGRSLIFN